jgi:hypothetical protein
MFINTFKTFQKFGTRFEINKNLHGFIMQQLQHPQKINDKLDAFMWNFAQTDDKISNDFIRVEFNKKITHTRMLILDYDGTMDPQDFLNRFKDFKFYLYTTISHTDEIPKFRVLLPLNKKLTKEMFDNLRHNITVSEKYFGVIDPRSFVISQGFYVPCVRPGQTLMYHYNEGNLFWFKEEDDELLNISNVRISEILNAELNSKNITATKYERKAADEIKNYDQYLKTSLKNIELDIASFDINNRDLHRNTCNKIYKWYKKLTFIYYRCKKNNPESLAIDFLKDFARHPKTIKNIENIK